MGNNKDKNDKTNKKTNCQQYEYQVLLRIRGRMNKCEKCLYEMYCLITNYYILFQQWHCALLHITPRLPSTQNSEVGDSEEVLLLHIIWKHSSTLARTKNVLQQWSMHSKETHVQMMRNWQISWSGSSLKHTSLANREMQNKMIGNDKIQLNTLATRNCIVPPTGIVNETIEHLFRNKCLCQFSW